MNTAMWRHPLTAETRRRLRFLGGNASPRRVSAQETRPARFVKTAPTTDRESWSPREGERENERERERDPFRRYARSQAPQLATLGSFGYGVVMPVSKTLACGDIGAPLPTRRGYVPADPFFKKRNRRDETTSNPSTGVGGLAELPVIVKALKDALGLP